MTDTQPPDSPRFLGRWKACRELCPLAPWIGKGIGFIYLYISLHIFIYLYISKHGLCGVVPKAAFVLEVLVKRFGSFDVVALGTYDLLVLNAGIGE